RQSEKDTDGPLSARHVELSTQPVFRDQRTCPAALPDFLFQLLDLSPSLGHRSIEEEVHGRDLFCLCVIPRVPQPPDVAAHFREDWAGGQFAFAEASGLEKNVPCLVDRLRW